MDKNTENIIKTLKLITFDTQPTAMKIFPVLFLQNSHLEMSDLNLVEIDWAISQLQRKNYLKKISKKVFYRKLSQLEKFAEQLGREILRVSGATDKEFLEVQREKLEEMGIRIKDTDDVEQIINVFEHPDMKKNITGQFEEEMGKSRVLYYYLIFGDLDKLIKDLEDGRPWSEIETNYTDVYFKNITSQLFILDEKPIKIARFKNTKTQHHQLLWEIFKRGKEKEHLFKDFVKDNIMKNKDVTSEDYRVMCKEIQKKITISTKNRVTDFLIFNSHKVQINPHYVKKSPQVTLHIT